MIQRFPKITINLKIKILVKQVEFQILQENQILLMIILLLSFIRRRKEHIVFVMAEKFIRIYKISYKRQNIFKLQLFQFFRTSKLYDKQEVVC